MAAVRQGSRPHARRGGQRRGAVAARTQWVLCRGDLGGGYYRRVIAPATRSPQAARGRTAVEEERR